MRELALFIVGYAAAGLASNWIDRRIVAAVLAILTIIAVVLVAFVIKDLGGGLFIFAYGTPLLLGAWGGLLVSTILAQLRLSRLWQAMIWVVGLIVCAAIAVGIVAVYAQVFV